MRIADGGPLICMMPLHLDQKHDEVVLICQITSIFLMLFFTLVPAFLLHVLAFCSKSAIRSLARSWVGVLGGAGGAGKR